MSTHESVPGSRPTLGWLIATLTGGALLLSTSACSSTPDDEPVDDIEVHVPSQDEADAKAAGSISPSEADAAYQKLADEIAKDR